MLVLTRRVGEEIVIGENVHVVLIGVRGGRARLGIDAPRAVGVRRSEKQVQREEGGSLVPSPARGKGD